MGKTKILLVEDDKNINKLINDYMTTHGFEVTSFEDGPEALDHVQMRGLPHIALIDLTLPTMHGFELSNRLKSMADVPIIFITATSDTDTVVQGLKKYAEDFIVKPFELRELEARVQVVLARMPSLDYASEPIIRIDDNLSIDFAHNRIVVNSKGYGLDADRIDFAACSAAQRRARCREPDADRPRAGPRKKSTKIRCAFTCTACAASWKPIRITRITSAPSAASAICSRCARRKASPWKARNSSSKTKRLCQTSLHTEIL